MPSSWLRSDDDCPYPRYYPAAWPIAVGEAQRDKRLAFSKAPVSSA
jgi:hypothetical protein